MKINKKIPVLHIISLSFIVFPVLSFALFGHGNKVAEAITNHETDMSNIELLSGESFDNSHIIYDDFSGNNLTDLVHYFYPPYLNDYITLTIYCN